jgi:hypothetical protein
MSHVSAPPGSLKLPGMLDEPLGSPPSTWISRSLSSSNVFSISMLEDEAMASWK